VAKNNKITTPNWHPNFRLPAELPDIKVIRTDFLINGFAAALILLSLFTIVKREFSIRSITQEVTALESSVKDLKKENESVVKVSESYRELSKEIEELEKFYDAPYDSAILLKQISEIRPEDILLSSISLTEKLASAGKKGPTSLHYDIRIAGNTRNLTIVSDFKGLLEAEELLTFEELETVVREDIQPPNSQTGLFPYTLNISIRPKTKKKGKG